MMRFILPALLLWASTANAAPPDLKGKTLKETFAELQYPIGNGESGARQRWQDICFAVGAPGNEKLRAEACTLMTGELHAKIRSEHCIWLLAQLQLIGGEESVAKIATTHKNTLDATGAVREAAVRALANNPSPKATAKLTEILADSKGNAKIGVLNALGYRGDPAALEAIAKELSGSDESAVAAARSLGRIPGPEAAKALEAARAASKGAVRAAIGDSLIAHADRLLKAGKAADAAAIYEPLISANEAKPIRLAALRGMIQSRGDKAGDLVLDVLTGTDASASAIALGQIENLSAGALKTLATSLDKLPAPSRVAVITAIAARGDRTQLPVALSAAKSTDTDVRRAGLLALGRLGDASAVELLLDVMSGKDTLAGIAAESLASLSAEGVDAKLIAVLEKEKAAARAVTLIGVLERRKAASAVPALLTSASGTDASVRTAAFGALKMLAAPEHVPAMIKALLKTEKGKEREAAEIAIATVCEQITNAEKRALPVVTAIVDKNEHAADLLPLLGRIGSKSALYVLAEQLRDESSALRSAAFTGICNWPDSTANDLLLKLAEKEKEAADRLKALQTLIRVNTVLVDRTPEERLAALNAMKKAMPLATRDDERRAIVAGLGFVRHIETLRFVLPYLEQPALAQAACKGVVELAHSKMLREPNKAEFDKALDKVIALCKDKALVDRARQYKEGR